jgi:hypothetical protein
VITESLDSDRFRVTHEQFANALGKHRNRVGMVTRELQKEGLIKCERGSISILHREGLEAVACECYRILRERMNSVGSA